MKKLLLAVLAVFSLSAHALDLRGIEIGAAKEDVDLSQLAKDGVTPYLACLQDTIHTVAPGRSEHCWVNWGTFRRAEIEVSPNIIFEPTLVFIDGKLVEIDGFYDSNAFNEAKALLTKKYGNPSIATGTLANAFGTQFDQQLATFKTKNGYVELYKRTNELGSGSITFTSKEGQAAIKAASKKAAGF